MPSESFNLEGTWQRAAAHICEAHNARIDPLSRGVALPASQRWAADLLIEPSLPQRDDFDRAHEALQVPRDQAVQRALSAIRRDLNEGRRKSLDAAEAIVDLVLNTYGLQPVPAGEPEQPYVLTPDDLGVVAYQIVLPPTT